MLVTNILIDSDTVSLVIPWLQGEVSQGVFGARYLGDIWFCDSILQSLPTVLAKRSAFTSQLLLTSPTIGPKSSTSSSCSRTERTG